VVSINYLSYTLVKMYVEYLRFYVTLVVAGCCNIVNPDNSLYKTRSCS